MTEEKKRADLGTVLVTGGAGYIGSHTVVELVTVGYKVVIVDSLINSKEECVRRVRKITGKDEDWIAFHKVDLCDKEALRAVFQKYPGGFHSAIHFAGLKAVGESVKIPLRYYENNLISTFNLLDVMEEFGCRKLVFSSSATVYGDAPLPLTEDSRIGVGITNPYGQTKFMIELILKDYFKSKEKSEHPWCVSVLRYFNPVGAHASGTIGEDPQGIPNNLMPVVSQAAVGKLPHVKVFGNDYATRDGTGVRDYIHVVDLALGHVAALDHLNKGSAVFDVYNLGSGSGVTVLEIIEGMRKASGKNIEIVFVDRRAGDLAEVYSESSKALKELGWKTERNFQQMCEDSWRWQSNNPKGYPDE
jgi:UDP-glucose 4-epimerase